MCKLTELCPVELKLQRSQLYLNPSCCTLIWLLRVFWSAVICRHCSHFFLLFIWTKLYLLLVLFLVQSQMLLFAKNTERTRHSDRRKTSHFHAFVWRVRSDCPSLRSSTHSGDIWACHALCAWSCCVCARCLWCWMFLDNVRIWIEHLHALTICAFLYYYYYCCLPWYSSESAMNYPKKRSKTFVEAYARCITENIAKRWLRQTLVV